MNYVTCSACGKRVSNILDREPVVRAWIECPECVQVRGNREDDEHVREVAKMRFIACDQLAGMFGSTIPKTEKWLDAAIAQIDEDDVYPDFYEWSDSR